MARFVIEGGRPLSGSVRPAGNKNEALPAMMACFLTNEPIVLKRMPRIGDVLTACDLLIKMGVAAEWSGSETLILDASKANVWKAPKDLCAKIRASILLLGPLLARFGRIELPLPGGDVIGARRMDTHFEGAISLGAQLSFGRAITGRVSKLVGTDLFLDEPSVTATENLLLLAVKAKGRTVIHNAACEPHVSGLAKLLVAMGAKIEGIGTNRLELTGVDHLHGAEHVIGSDFMEIGSFLCLGAIGGGVITIEEHDVDYLRFAMKTLARIGIKAEQTPKGIVVDGTTRPKIGREISGRIATVYSGPWPAYPTDLMSVAIVAATQAEGTMLFFEKMFEGRMFFTDRLVEMGAQLVLCDPHRVVVSGPSQLYGTEMSSPDIRAGMALLMAALVAQGKSVIENIGQIERGFSGIDHKLQALGASIIRRE